jgi:hypothetical protein
LAIVLSVRFTASDFSWASYCLSDLRLLLFPGHCIVIWQTIQWPREIRRRKSGRQYNGQEKSEAINQTDNTMAKRNQICPIYGFWFLLAIVLSVWFTASDFSWPLYCLPDLRLLISLGHCIVCQSQEKAEAVNQTDNTIPKRNQKP